MKILVVGGGGREHSIVWKLAQSTRVKKIYCTPGNGGISEIAKCLPYDAMDFDGIVKASNEKNVNLVVVAPDNPLAAGLVDRLNNAGIKAFGPDKDAALIESSKSFSKNLMKEYGIPTAEYEVFNNYEQAVKYLKKRNYPLVIKADGLALGKGVIIAECFEQAEKVVKDIMCNKIFGDSGEKIIIEDFLTGVEVSILTFTDGKTIVPMIASQDHKKAWDNDEGPNTGGMGAFAPSGFYTPDVAEYCMNNIFKPTVTAMNNKNRKFKGVLYFGLILTDNGPKVLEYNSRFGDPEAQVILPLLKSDLVEIIEAIIDEKLDTVNINWDQRAAVCIVAASGGYPVKYEKGYEITGLKDIDNNKDVTVFHAGSRKKKGKYLTDGGRVLGVTAVGDTMKNAVDTAYRNIAKINFKDIYYRSDIGKKGI